MLISRIRAEVLSRESWMKEVWARVRHCTAPSHWSRNLFVHPPCDAEFPAVVAEKFDDGQPWPISLKDIMENSAWGRYHQLQLKYFSRATRGSSLSLRVAFFLFFLLIVIRVYSYFLFSFYGASSASFFSLAGG